ncbi:hypothetical protein AB6A40_003903 [Gnathostoma spinigerum]|uniref:Transcription elongation factor n=1 Tax=Gnathostoma spinigerum TaxID=75299 RepID=A0ABD6EIM8_9BILA
MVTCEDEVMRIGKKFEKMIAGSKSMDGALELLEALSHLPVDINVLTKTRIGMTINELRKKTSDEVVAKRAKSLIKEWKALLENKGMLAHKDVMPRNDSSSSNLSERNGLSKHHLPTTGATKPTSPPPPTAATSRSSQPQSSTPSKPLHSDETRNKCAIMLLNALRSKELPDGSLDPEDLARRIEDKLFEVHRGTGDKYKAALRSRVFNLRDKKNTALRENVLLGVVTPEKFAVMTSEEMASDEIRKQRDAFTKEAILEHQMSVQEGTPSDMFKCGKCGKKNCTYTQVQTRSADEPMTTFVFCRECGNRWKFC